jgi:hypothetical protein
MIDVSSSAPPRLLVDGIAQFNRGEYYEQHETLETLWRAEPGPVRRLYQGILQIGVAFHHVQRGNHHGATVMLERGLRNVRPFAPACQGVDVEQFITEAERAQEAIAALGPERLAAFNWQLAPRVYWTGGKVE